MTRFFKMVLLFAGITMPATAQAAAIYIADHNTTFNQTFEMINDSTNTYRFVITATFDPSGPITAPNGAPSGFETIDAVAFQINDTPDFTISLFSAPSTGGTWTLKDGGLNANAGCNGNGDFYCVGTNGTGPGVNHGLPLNVMTWAFTVDFADNLPNLLEAGGHLKIRALDANGRKVEALISEDLPWEFLEECTACEQQEFDAPEPASMALMGTGLTAIAVRLRRRRAAKARAEKS